MMDYYKGIEVLTERGDRGPGAETGFSRGVSVIASAVGKRLVLDRWGVPSVVRAFTWVAIGREEIAKLKAFITRRKGRVVPVWVATDNADLVLARAAQAGNSSIRIKRIGYAGLVFPTGSGRRHIAVKQPGGTRQAFKVLSATDGGDGTETLALDGQLAHDYQAGTFFSYMTLCRLESDDVRLAYTTPEVCEARLQFVELPKETPS